MMPNFWSVSQTTQAVRIWCGLAFERVALQHLEAIKRKLGISGVVTRTYGWRFRDDGKARMAENFRHFCDRRNYPVIVHCIGGADRTGSLSYVLNGVLGVARHDLEVDWESTFYPKIPDENPDPRYWCRESHFNDGFSKYGKDGDSWNRRIELYLLDCGVTEAEIATFREIMLEPSDGK